MDLERDRVNLRKCSEGTSREMYIYIRLESVSVCSSLRRREERGRERGLDLEIEDVSK